MSFRLAHTDWLNSHFASNGANELARLHSVGGGTTAIPQKQSPRFFRGRSTLEMQLIIVQRRQKKVLFEMSGDKRIEYLKSSKYFRGHL